ncbi:MAG: DNA polymerase III subunit gamma/tau [Parcubacteria group bacterium]|nr:DNA polymerase III subunit gamma/tau [Parcubacteria group bacterium]
MSYQVLYRKYRPKKFSEIIGQNHIVGTLMNAVKSGRVGHAYLFSGPRGTGKTTIARILAKTVNCANLSKISGGNIDDKLSVRRSEAKADSYFFEPCNSCELCLDFNESRNLDLIEIDAASSRGIDEVRELREGARFSPSRSKFKVYIIDEVHMMTKEAFNALLKTLEEPPAHAIFILATTEPDRLPLTIRSRCQHFHFWRPSVNQIIERLKFISREEKIKAEESALRLIAKSASGSMRDAESLFGQVITLEDKEIKKEEVEEILGVAPSEFVKNFLRHVSEKDARSAIHLVGRIYDEGYDLGEFNKNLITDLRHLLLLKIDPKFKTVLKEDLTSDEIEELEKMVVVLDAKNLENGLKIFLEANQNIKKFVYPQLALEMAVVEYCGIV